MTNNQTAPFFIRNLPPLPPRGTPLTSAQLAQVFIEPAAWRRAVQAVEQQLLNPKDKTS